MFIVVSYDIKDDKRRNRVLNILKDYGTHVQYSVFECNLNVDQLGILKQKLAAVINSSEDNIRVYILCEDCKRKIIIEGDGNVTEEDEVYVV